MFAVFATSKAKTQMYLTRCSAIAERPRCRVRYSFGQKWRLELGDMHASSAVKRGH